MLTLRPAAWTALVALVLLASVAPSIVSFPFVAVAAVLSVPVLGPAVCLVTLIASVHRIFTHPAAEEAVA